MCCRHGSAPTPANQVPRNNDRARPTLTERSEPLALGAGSCPPPRVAARAVATRSGEASPKRVWAASALDVVRNLSTEVILLKSDNEEEVERVLPRTMTELTEAA